jgi:serpin B
VLVDAVYLKAPWATPFDPNATAQAPFHVSPTSTVSVQMMSTPGSFDVAVRGTPAVDAVELPYVGGHLSALVLMPPLGDLRAFEATLTPALVGRTVAGLARLRAEVDLPRFSFGTALSMKQALSAMGMGQAFNDNADFSNLSPMPVRLSFVVHEAWVKVMEKGTEAAAASAAGIGPTAIAAPRERLVFDHPFLFLVRDNATGAILFEAQVTNPAIE